MLHYNFNVLKIKYMQSISQIMDLSGKTAIVTGGAMGIGLGIAQRLAEAGANVVIADFNKEAGEKTAKELSAAGKKVEFIKCDVSNEKDIVATVEFAAKKFGGLDILVNNAGIYPQIPAMQMDSATFEKILNVNLKGVFIFCKAASEQMIKQGKGGKIINITSIDALHPSSVGLAAYDSSKHGLWGFTKNFALEVSPHKIQVNAVAPGGIATPGTGSGAPATPQMKEIIEKFQQRIPMHRMGEPDDIGKVVLFLATDLASYMTGSQIVVDGGVLLS